MVLSTACAADSENNVGSIVKLSLAAGLTIGWDGDASAVS